MTSRVVIVGAGPAGLRAAELLAYSGLSPILLDEAPRIGGQIYRLPPNVAGLTRSAQQLYGSQARKAHTLFRDFERIQDKVDYRPSSLVFDLVDNRVEVLRFGKTEQIGFDALILATGAMDRVMPFDGWTLPGIYSLGGAQIALKHQGCAIGRSVVFAGTGPLLFLTAYQYAKAGAKIAAVINSAPRLGALSQLGKLAAMPAMVAQGLHYLSWFRRHKIRVLHGYRPLRAHAAVPDADTEAGPGNASEPRLAMMEFISDRGDRLEVDCDAAAFGYGLKAETQLADLAGASFGFDAVNRQWLPLADAYGRAQDRAGLYLAGDGAGILGADAAELRGQLAAAAVLSDFNQSFGSFDPNAALRQLQKWRKFRAALELAFPFPHESAPEIADDVILCRCESVTAGELRGVTGLLGARDLNRTKAFCRLGMGRCQGRLCGPVAAEVMAAELGVSVDSVGRFRGQPPVKPVPVSALAMPEPLVLTAEDHAWSGNVAAETIVADA
ncbi:MAG TPA: NAD(P)/FAD-dependent oxidoreductase [Dongiaceae bacterium]|nr:NAD(P)/FAD-dependent oxidoreductase [Dongiaceae bacterium]